MFPDGRVLSSSFNSPIASAAGGGVLKKQRNSNKISIKIQSDKWKRPLQMDIQKTDKFRILYIKCSEELNVAIDDIKLRYVLNYDSAISFFLEIPSYSLCSFDGEPLELNDTPSDIELEGGEVIDLRLKK